ncbi:hypothetical protein AXG93_383s1000 [Marchantia polymorpha subsp. ruderalis]|uniref:Uncharacterized protein n=1 Tax=Marchantia polymorpha subsp. ruderalis TaxID=1480154 RepID=A0A176VHV0_MARPO|nr:hypothetical protein AXG93_383s1000 [Marchantia polymorpha subsp. ruderalis]
MRAPQERAAEVLTVSSDIEKDPVALEEVAAKAVEDVKAAECGSQKVASPRTSTKTVILETGEEPSEEEAQSQVLGAADVLCVQVLLLLQYLNRKQEKYADASTNVSYVEIVRNQTRTKVVMTAEVAAKECKTQTTEARYQALHKRLTEEVEKRRHSREVCEGLREDVERAKCASVDLLKRLEACRTTYDAKSLKVDELLAITEKKEQEYQIELAVRAKKLTEYKVARISDLELIQKLEAQCNELRTQRSQAEEQLCKVETRLTQAKRKNRQLFEETRDALTAIVERCLRGCVQILGVYFLGISPPES